MKRVFPYYFVLSVAVITSCALFVTQLNNKPTPFDWNIGSTLMRDADDAAKLLVPYVEPYSGPYAVPTSWRFNPIKNINEQMENDFINVATGTRG